MTELFKRLISNDTKIPVLFFIGGFLLLLLSNPNILSALLNLITSSTNTNIELPYHNFIAKFGIGCIILSIILLLITFLYRNYILAKNKSKPFPNFSPVIYETKEQGSINFISLANINDIKRLQLEKNNKILKVKDLIEHFKKFASINIPNKFLKIEIDRKTKEEITIFTINNTRISTFLCFTDKKRIVLFNRNSENIQTTVKNPRYDCFGSISFENSTMLLKINNEEFFDSKIEDLELIPGFAYEYNTTPNNISYAETVIMFGFIVYLSKDHLNNATKNSKDVLILDIENSLLGTDNLTAKAKLAIDYLRTRILNNKSYKCT